TLGVVQYRAGNWQASRQALDKSMQLHNGGDSLDYYFLAMVHHRQGDTAEARRWLDKAKRWLDEATQVPPVAGRRTLLPGQRQELLRLRREAEALLKAAP